MKSNKPYFYPPGAREERIVFQKTNIIASCQDRSAFFTSEEKVFFPAEQKESMVMSREEKIRTMNIKFPV